MRYFFWLLLVPMPLWALTNAYVSFDHPEGWKCELSQGVWICQSALEPDRREAVVLSIATMASEWDTIENYEEWLKTARTIQDEEEKTYTAEVKYVRKRNINGHTWVDSLQYNSELPGFWTRYVVTVHQTPSAKLAILMTYVVSDERYKQLAPQFERMISSLKPNQEFDLNIATRQGDTPLPGSQKLGPDQKSILLNRLNTKKKEAPKEEAPPADNTIYLLGGVGLAAVVALVVIRRRKAKKKTQPGSGQPPKRRVG